MMEERKPSCEFKLTHEAAGEFEEVVAAAKPLPKSELEKIYARKGFEDQPELIKQAESMGITPAKLKAMKDYAAILVKQDKRIKPSTVRKKVLEKFKIKLV